MGFFTPVWEIFKEINQPYSEAYYKVPLLLPRTVYYEHPVIYHSNFDRFSTLYESVPYHFPRPGEFNIAKQFYFIDKKLPVETGFVTDLFISTDEANGAPAGSIGAQTVAFLGIVYFVRFITKYPKNWLRFSGAPSVALHKQLTLRRTHKHAKRFVWPALYYGFFTSMHSKMARNAFGEKWLGPFFCMMAGVPILWRFRKAKLSVLATSAGVFYYSLYSFYKFLINRELHRTRYLITQDEAMIDHNPAYFVHLPANPYPEDGFPISYFRN